MNYFSLYNQLTKIKTSARMATNQNQTQDQIQESIKSFESLPFYTLIELAPNNPEINEYLASFHPQVTKALHSTETPADSVPYRGEITYDNLAELFVIMPDLYEYLSTCYSAIESSGDLIINRILDEAHHNQPYSTPFEKVKNYFNYIQKSYYNEYLKGHYPTAFSIDDWKYPEPEPQLFPREWFWWDNE